VPFSLPSFFWASKRKKGARALPLFDIPVTAALIHPWMSPPLSNQVRADARVKINSSRSDTVNLKREILLSGVRVQLTPPPVFTS
jgi:hypothetical protein